MGERRTAIRVPCALPAEAAQAGASSHTRVTITDLSPSGIGLRAPHAFIVGHSIDLSLNLPNEDGPLPLRGELCWQSGSSSDGYRSGIALRFLNAGSRRRLAALLAAQSPPPRPSKPAGWWSALTRRLPGLDVRWRAMSSTVCVILGVSLIAVEGHNQYLRHRLAAQTQRIAELEQQQRVLAARIEQASKVQRVSAEAAQSLQTQVDRLDDELARMTAGFNQLADAFARVQQEREALRRRVAELEAQQTEFRRRLGSLPALRSAVHQAKEQIRQERRDEFSQAMGLKRQIDRELHDRGNRGYLVRQGKSMPMEEPAVPGGRLSVRVLTPEAAEGTGR